MAKDFTRNVPAMDTTTRPGIWEMTRAEAVTYYWLLAHSKRSPGQINSPYHIYRNSFTLAQIRQGTNIKSDNTIRTALSHLEDKGIIQRDDRTRSYSFSQPQIYVPMASRVILVLLAFNKYINSNILIMILAILSKLTREAPLDITKTELALLMGKAKQHVNEMDVTAALYLLRGLGLIEFEVAQYTNRLGTWCSRYHVTATHPRLEGFEDILNEDERVDSISVDKLWGNLIYSD